MISKSNVYQIDPKLGEIVVNMIKTKLNKFSVLKYFAEDDVHAILMPLYLVTKALAITPYSLRKIGGKFEYFKSKLGNVYCCVFVTLFVGKLFDN